MSRYTVLCLLCGEEVDTDIAYSRVVAYEKLEGKKIRNKIATGEYGCVHCLDAKSRQPSFDWDE